MDSQLETIEKPRIQVIWIFALWSGLFWLAHTPYHSTIGFLNFAVGCLLWWLPALMLVSLWIGSSRLIFKILKCVSCAFLLLAITIPTALINPDKPLFGSSFAGEPIVIDSKNSIVWREFTTDLFNQGPCAEQLEQFQQVFPGIECRHVLKKVSCRGVTVTSTSRDKVVFHTNEEPNLDYVVPLLK
jgi:hypothetical protein